MSVTASLEDRVAALEAFAAVQTPADDLSPNYLTVTPQGVGADFTGLVNALGLVLPLSTSVAPGPPNKIEWQNKSNGAVVASITSYGDIPAGNTTAMGMTVSPDTVQASQVFLEADDQAGRNGLSLAVTHDPFVPVDQLSLTRVVAGVGHQTNLWRSDGQSTFLQLLTQAQLQLWVGVVQLTWPGATPYSNDLAVVHNIGRVPQAVAGLCGGFVGTAAVLYLDGPVTAAQFTLRGFTTSANPGAGASANAFLLAIG